MMTTDCSAKIVVLGMGNMLLKDEGIGVHIAQALQGKPSSGNINLEVIDGGTLPDMPPLSLDGVDKLIIIDAVRGGSKPGTIYRFRPEDIKLDNGTVISVHQVSLLENLWLMEQFGQKPENIVIIGVEPEDMNCGLELSAKLQQRLPRILEVVLGEVGLSHAHRSEKGR